MLTAIVVGVATLAVGLATIVRIREAYGTVETDEIREMDLDVAIAEAADEAEETQAANGAV
jgi:multicomponent Na+:H+ antiporter subunit C